MKNKYGFLWVTLGIFAITLTAHWISAWFAYVQDAQEHRQQIEFGNYAMMTFRDTMEN